MATRNIGLSSLRRMFAVTFIALALSACGGGSGGNDNPNPPPPPPDTKPDPFGFTEITDLFPGTLASSDTVTISGMDAGVKATVRVSGGEYRIDGGNWTGANGEIANNSKVQVRGSASEIPEAEHAVILTIDTVSGNFTLHTGPADMPADTRPEKFELPAPARADVTPGEAQLSEPFIVTGINAGSAIVIDGLADGVTADYRIDGGDWTSEPGTVYPGQSVEVRLTAPAENDAVAEARLTIGDTSAVFTVITPPAEGASSTRPDPLPKTIATDRDPDNLNPGEPIIFGPITPTGFTGSIPVSIVDADISIDGGGSWLNGQATTPRDLQNAGHPKVSGASVTLPEGAELLVRVTASEQPNTRKEALLNLNGVTAVFAVTTANIPIGSDTTPDTFAFDDVNEVSPGSLQISNTVVITGIDAPAAISISGGEYRVDGGQWLTADSVIVNNQTLALRVVAPSTPNTTSEATVIVGGVSATFTVTTGETLPENRAPVAIAGSDQTVNGGAAVTLDGSASSDPDGDVLAYTWQQTGGPTVALTGANTAGASFNAPNVDASTALTFQLTVSDGILNDSATVVITVNPVIADNQPPVANAGLDQTVDENTLVTLDGRGSSDPEGAALAFQWTQIAGPNVTLSNANGAQPTFLAPDVVANTTLTFRLTVSDGVLSSSDTVTVTVRFVNQPPAANAGEDQTVDARSAVTLDGRGSSDPDGQALTYAWTQTAGPDVTLDNANSAQPTFTAPDVDANTTLAFRLTVSDGTLENSATVTINVLAVNRAPVAHAGNDATVNAGAEVSLDGSGSNDPDGDPLTYAWQQTGGPNVALTGANTASASFAAPAVDTSTALTFELTVSDGALNDSATIVITVNPVIEDNHPPVADAGPDQAVDENTLVTLDGRGSSDPEGAALSFQWTQIAGPNVTLSNANGAQPTFLAPDVVANTALTFRLTVSDGVLSSSDTVTITVRFVNQPPVANAGGNKSVNEGEAFTLNGSGSDPDGDTITFQWTVPDGFTATGQNTATLNVTATPDVTEDTDYVFTLTVTDSHGASTSSNAVVTLRFVNQPPMANAGGNKSVNEGEVFTLNGSGSDPDGGTVTFQWTVPDGFTATGQNTATLNVTATPDVAEDTDYVFTLTVTDSHGANTSSNAVVTLRFVNQPPVANAGGNKSVNEGEAFTLNGSGSDPDGDTITFQWTVPDGFTATGQNTATLNVTATPDVAEDTDYVFTLTVTDSHGASTSSNAVVTLRFVNQLPVANAGGNKSVNEGEAFTLNGSGSDPDGDIITFQWTVPSGFTATGQNAATLNVTATPEVTEDTDYVFTLTVTDSHGASGTSSATVKVKPVPSELVRASVAFPLDNARTTAKTITLRGYADDGNGGPVQAVLVNGEAANLNQDTGEWSREAPLVHGPNAFTVSVTPVGGAAMSAATVNVNRAARLMQPSAFVLDRNSDIYYIVNDAYDKRTHIRASPIEILSYDPVTEVLDVVTNVMRSPVPWAAVHGFAGAFSENRLYLLVETLDGQGRNLVEIDIETGEQQVLSFTVEQNGYALDSEKLSAITYDLAQGRLLISHATGTPTDFRIVAMEPVTRQVSPVFQVSRPSSVMEVLPGGDRLVASPAGDSNKLYLLEFANPGAAPIEIDLGVSGLGFALTPVSHIAALNDETVFVAARESGAVNAQVVYRVDLATGQKETVYGLNYGAGPWVSDIAGLVFDSSRDALVVGQRQLADALPRHGFLAYKAVSGERVPLVAGLYIEDKLVNSIQGMVYHTTADRPFFSSGITATHAQAGVRARTDNNRFETIADTTAVYNLFHNPNESNKVYVVDDRGANLAALYAIDIETGTVTKQRDIEGHNTNVRVTYDEETDTVFWFDILTSNDKFAYSGTLNGSDTVQTGGPFEEFKSMEQPVFRRATGEVVFASGTSALRRQLYGYDPANGSVGVLIDMTAEPVMLSGLALDASDPDGEEGVYVLDGNSGEIYWYDSSSGEISKRVSWEAADGPVLGTHRLSNGSSNTDVRGLSTGRTSGILFAGSNLLDALLMIDVTTGERVIVAE